MLSDGAKIILLVSAAPRFSFPLAVWLSRVGNGISIQSPPRHWLSEGCLHKVYRLRTDRFLVAQYGKHLSLTSEREKAMTRKFSSK